jgi:glycosyltransferase involved in cell wall biosynthesis
MNGISVIIPAYNAAKFLGAAIQSVLDQTLEATEIIVVDDGSTDETPNLVKSFAAVRYIRQANEGPGGAVNTGVRNARGECLAFLDADDLWLPNKLEKQNEIIEKDQSVDIVFTGIVNFFEEALSTDDRKKFDIEPRPMAGIQRSTLFIRTETFLNIGFFSTTSPIELLDWYSRAKEMNLKEQVLPEVLVRRRIHGSNLTITRTGHRNEFPNVIKKILDRRRSQ